ncbi:MAG: vitamin K epoxide reductase family protein [Gemmatimonadota bacterium]|nr:vitamin K epoxide reductase family protein [Gemmatimonadota bacterium]
MTHRMVSAALALIGLLVSLYLWLWKIGLLGALACGDGACERVQLSPYAQIAGIPVAFFGVVGYLGILVASLAGLQDRLVHRRWPTDAILVLAGIGVAFSGYLTYLEAAVIHAWCRWCIVSAIIIVVIFGAAIAGRMGWERESVSR